MLAMPDVTTTMHLSCTCHRCVQRSCQPSVPRLDQWSKGQNFIINLPMTMECKVTDAKPVQNNFKYTI